MASAHRASSEDLAFREGFEQLGVKAADFDHRAHVRLAYIYLCDRPADAAHDAMKAALLAFLKHLGVESSKFHETITRAWIMAVRHFMKQTPACTGAAEFIERNPPLLDTKIMLTHYSAAVLFSPAAREGFVEPDISPIPRH